MIKKSLFVTFLVVLAGLIGWYLADPPEIPTLTELGIEHESAFLSLEDKTRQFLPGIELVEPQGYINTDNITIEELIGEKVILVDFWTYSCINCQRTIPYLNAWYEKYEDQGLEIIGVHTPEFAFEEVYENVVDAVNRWGIEYPVVQDNEYRTWNAYANRFWPRKYIIDIDGFLVYDHIGEGAYEETERVIQELLEERRVKLGIDTEVESGMVDPDAESVTHRQGKSPEIYFGSKRNQWLGNGELSASPQTFTIPETLQRDTIYLEGEWQFDGEFATNLSADAKIVFPYAAEKLFMVAGAETPITATILRDGEPVGAAAGSSLNTDGTVQILEPDLYRLIEDPEGFGQHTIEIILEEPGAQIFTFTFG